MTRDPAETASPATTRRPIYRRPLPWASLTLLVALGAALVLIPQGIRHGLKVWLLERGADRVQVENVDFNPFLAELRLYGVTVATGTGVTLRLPEALLTYRWLPFSKRRFEISRISITGLDLPISQDAKGFSVAGVRLDDETPAEEPGKPWGIGLQELTLRDSVIHFHGAKLRTRLEIDQASLSRLVSWEPDKAASLTLSGRLNGAPLEVDAELHGFDADPDVAAQIKLNGYPLAALHGLAGEQLTSLGGALSIDGRLSAVIDERGLALTQQGTTTIKDGKLASPDLALQFGTFTWDSGTPSSDGRLGAIITERGLALTQQGTTTIKDGKLASPDLALQFDTLTWGGRNQHLATQRAGESPATPVAEGRLSVAQLELALPGRQPFDFQAGSLAVNDLSLSSASALGIGEVQGTKLWLIDSASKAPLLHLAKLDLKRITLDQNQALHIASGRGESLAVGPQLIVDASEAQGAVLRAKALVFDALALAPGESLALDQVVLDSADSYTSRDADGTWLAPVRTLLRRLAGTEGEAKADESEAATRLRIDRLAFVGDSRVHFSDEAVEPRFAVVLDIEQAEYTQLDSGRPEQPSDVTIKARIGKYTTLALQGRTKLFAPTVDVELTGAIRNLNLPLLSPYAKATIGYVVESGQLDTDLTLKISARQLAGEDKLILNNLALRRADEKRAAALSAQIGMSLDSALDILRDSDDNIKLTVPISGNLDDPQFSMRDAINQATGKAVQLATLSYLKYAFQPYGTLITIGQYLGEKAGEIKLDPVVLAPGEAQPNAQAQDYLAKLAEILNKRPELRIKLCATATAADRAALQAAKPDLPVDETALRQLAQKRAEQTKDWLVEQHQIAPKRLFVCEPRVDLEPDAVPRVDLRI